MAVTTEKLQRERPCRRLALVFTVALATLLALAFIAPSPAYAASNADYETWNQIVDDMESILEDAYATYEQGDVAAAKTRVDDAYYGYYEALGFEKTVMAHISGDRAAAVEYQFSFAKRAMEEGRSADARASLDTLISLLREDATTLDGGSGNPFVAFFGSLVIILREGFEAILVVGAIIAYLVKSGNKKQARPVYIGSGLALVASVGLAFALTALSAASGANQEIIEGATMLLAVLVLFYVSNWMISKADASSWKSYIEGKVSTSITRGSVFALAFAAFLAVFREGAETILFYSALFAGTDAGSTSMVWLGLGVGAVALVAIFLIIRFLSIRLPIKPFFTGTSLVMFALCITFVGSGIKELQEGGVIGVTAIPGMPTVDILGIYPTVETLVPQLIILGITVITITFQIRKWKKNKSVQQTGEPQ
ncbi:MAG: FTR1 family iron permease [Coriobacteriales bacterium]|nr:FTR1 family iron permease [Coriobacteriales bacterium]